ncbi:MAG: hypothetical protein JWO83_303 [Caulobacteraceae bacterium]|nr:hypothetical protein [Caulobacteraceae bacterium]
MKSPRSLSTTPGRRFTTRLQSFARAKLSHGAGRSRRMSAVRPADSNSILICRISNGRNPDKYTAVGGRVMKRSRVKTAAIAFLVACISRITGDMILSTSSYGKAFGNTVAGGNSPAAFGSHFRPTLIRAKSNRHNGRADDGARTFAPLADIGSSATLQAPLSAHPYVAAPVSVAGPLRVDSDLLNGIPGGERGPTAGGGGPGGGGLPTGGPPGGGFPNLPPSGPPGGGGPGKPPVVGVPEPSDWSMMVFGLLALGLPLRLSARGRSSSLRKLPQVFVFARV